MDLHMISKTQVRNLNTLSSKFPWTISCYRITHQLLSYTCIIVTVQSSDRFHILIHWVDSKTELTFLHLNWHFPQHNLHLILSGFHVSNLLIIPCIEPISTPKSFHMTGKTIQNISYTTILGTDNYFQKSSILRVRIASIEVQEH